MVEHEVITAERVAIHYRVAGIGSRFLAWLVDFVLIVLLYFVGLLFGNILEIRRQGLGQAVFLLWAFGVTWGYFLLFEWLWYGQTPGKRLVRIRVIQLDGTSVGFLPAAVRNILRAADGLPLLLPVLPPFLYALGFFVAICNRNQRRLGDLTAGTLVVFVDRKTGPIRALAAAGLEADRAREMILRQRLGQLDREQKQTLLDLCLRREQLRVSDRSQLFAAQAEYFKQRLGLTPGEYQSDEKFVLELAGALNERSPVEDVPGRRR